MWTDISEPLKPSLNYVCKHKYDVYCYTQTIDYLLVITNYTQYVYVYYFKRNGILVLYIINIYLSMKTRELTYYRCY